MPQLGGAGQGAQLGVAHLQRVQAGEGVAALCEAERRQAQVLQYQREVACGCGGCGGLPARLGLQGQLALGRGHQVGLQVGGQALQRQVVQRQFGVHFLGQRGAAEADGGRGAARCRGRGGGLGRRGPAARQLGRQLEAQRLRGVGGQRPLQRAGAQLQLGQRQLGGLGRLRAGVGGEGVAPVDVAAAQVKAGGADGPTAGGLAFKAFLCSSAFGYWFLCFCFCCCGGQGVQLALGVAGQVQAGFGQRHRAQVGHALQRAHVGQLDPGAGQLQQGLALGVGQGHAVGTEHAADLHAGRGRLHKRHLQVRAQHRLGGAHGQLVRQVVEVGGQVQAADAQRGLGGLAGVEGL